VAAYNWAHTAKLAELGAGGEPTPLFYSMMAAIVMELRRWLGGEAAAKPTASEKPPGTGRGGNQLAQMGLRLEAMCNTELEALRTSLRDNKFTLEGSGKVKLLRSHQEPVWRSMGLTMTDEETATMGV
jgi:hypothetical protein